MQKKTHDCAKVKDLQFHNGTIEVKLLSRLLPDAPDFARGFIGIVYRANADNSEFEAFYVRPANGRTCTDAGRRAHGLNLISDIVSIDLFCQRKFDNSFPSANGRGSNSKADDMERIGKGFVLTGDIFISSRGL